ncbi:uncharacterized protein [Primulina huaijiensis]|uniref:uncharacterized protein n=1 Tax=Primulina huaijiensis TaxID=1492673 RepID=UPI003CC71BC2
MFFADDMVQFAEASTQQLNVILECLNWFCSRSGQKVNRQKSHIFVSRNVEEAVANNLSSISGIPSTTDLGSMSGYHQFMGESLGVRYWCSPCLNPSHYIRYKLAFYRWGYALKLKNNSKLYVGRTEWERKCHLVNWEVCVDPKSKGGLGVKRLHPRNLAFKTKLGWRLMEEKDSFWARVLKGKYMQTAPNGQELQAKQGASNAWQGITKVANFLELGRKVAVRNGKSTCFWIDKWVGNEPLSKFLLKDIDLVERYKKVHEYWIRRIGWNSEALNEMLPTHMKNILVTCIVSNNEDIEDSRCWDKTSKGDSH